ncbi:unnamed protein product [Penicillium bialowiezense]
MSRPGNFDHMVGTDFHLAHSFLSPPGALRLDDIMSEVFQTFSRDRRESERGPPFAVLKFACHNTADPTQQGFLRVYIQIPYDNTIRGSREARALQAEPSPTHNEYEALVALETNTSMAVPNLLGYGQGKQGPEAYVPRGYVLYVAWERISGSPIDPQIFWREDNQQYRDEVRAAFAVAYRRVSSLVFMVSRYIAGFSSAKKDEDKPLSPIRYALWGLMKHPDKDTWHLDQSEWTW